MLNAKFIAKYKLYGLKKIDDNKNHSRKSVVKQYWAQIFFR